MIRATTLLIPTALLALLTSCCHSRYSEASRNAVALFHLEDSVVLSADSTPCRQNLSVCKNTGVVVDIVDIKNHCYPQASYEIKFYHHIDTYVFCGADLILLPATKENQSDYN